MRGSEVISGISSSLSRPLARQNSGMKTENEGRMDGRAGMESVPKPIWKNRGRKDDPILDTKLMKEWRRKQSWGEMARKWTQFRKSCLFTHNFLRSILATLMENWGAWFWTFVSIARLLIFPPTLFSLPWGTMIRSFISEISLDIFIAPLLPSMGSFQLFSSKLLEFLSIFL